MERGHSKTMTNLRQHVTWPHVGCFLEVFSTSLHVLFRCSFPPTWTGSVGAHMISGNTYLLWVSAGGETPPGKKNRKTSLWTCCLWSLIEIGLDWIYSLLPFALTLTHFTEKKVQSFPWLDTGFWPKQEEKKNMWITFQVWYINALMTLSTAVSGFIVSCTAVQSGFAQDLMWAVLEDVWEVICFNLFHLWLLKLIKRDNNGPIITTILRS